MSESIAWKIPQSRKDIELRAMSHLRKPLRRQRPSRRCLVEWANDGRYVDGQHSNGVPNSNRVLCVTMHSFHYQRGKLTCESYPLDKAAERYGTPLYVYSSHTILDHYKRLDQALHELRHEI